MNAEVVANTTAADTTNAAAAAAAAVTSLLNRHIAHMAESAIQQTTTSTTTGSSSNPSPGPKSVEECGQQLMSLWRPIVCRSGGGNMFPPPSLSPSSADPGPTANHHKKSSSAGESSSSSSSIANSKSIPVHCVVMNTTTPCYLSDAAATLILSGKSSGEEVDVDTYAIIPASTLFTQIVPAVLRKLGYSDDVVFNANGWLMMKNWRPLALTQIASSDRETVGGVLGELTTVATLRIYIRKNQSSGTSSAQSEMKSKVLRWLMRQSHHVLNSSRCPLDEKWQQKVMRGERPNTPSPDTVRQFDSWFQQEMSRPSPLSQQQPPIQGTGNNRIATVPVDMKTPPSHRISPADHHQHHHQQTGNMAVDPLSTTPARDSVGSAGGALPPRVRMRTTFDPEQELPRLQRWFSENQHPTRFQLQLFVQELNELDSRRGRKPLDVSNLVYWFKNARAAYKRAEVRQTSGGGGGQNHHDAGQQPDPCWMGSAGVGGLGGGRRCLLGDESSDDQRGRLEDDDAGHVEEEEDEEDEDSRSSCSSISDRSGGSFDRRRQPLLPPTPLKAEPEEPHILNRSADERDAKEHREEEDGQDQVDPLDGRDHHHLHQDGGDEGDEDEVGSQPSDSDSDMEDYAENLSLSKNPADGVDGKKDLLLPASATSSGGQSDYSPYPGFPLSLSHAQLNPHGLVYMTSPYLQGIGSSLLHHSNAAHHHHLHHHHHRSGGLDPLSLASGGGGVSGMGGGVGGGVVDDRRKRNRTFIDPVTEVPRLEHWFSLNTHPSHSLVLRYTEELNRQPYRLKFPKLEPKNVQFWFKNRRAKCKRLKLTI